MPEDSAWIKIDPGESASLIKIDPDLGHHPVQSQCMETDPEEDQKSSSQSLQNQIPVVHSTELEVQEELLILEPGFLDPTPEGAQNAIRDPEEIPKITIQDLEEHLRFLIQDPGEPLKAIILDPEGHLKAIILDPEELLKVTIQAREEAP